MLIRNFDSKDIFVRCRVCHKAHPKSDFPTLQRVCIDCAHNMNWKLPDKKRRRKR